MRSSNSVLTWPRRLYESRISIWQRGTQTRDDEPRRARTSQRDGSPREPQHDRPRAARQRPPVALGAGQPDRPDPQRHPRRSSASWSAAISPSRAQRPWTARPAGHRPCPPRPARPGRPRARDRRRLAGGRGRRSRRRGLRARSRVDLPRGRTEPRRRSSTSWPSWPSTVRAALPEDDVIIGTGVAMVGVVRRSDGMVSMAPNLGWRDEPLGERLADALGMDVPIAIANESDLAVLAEHRRGAARGVDDVLLIWGSVGRRWRPDRQRRTADRVGRLQRRGRAHPGQPRRPAVPLRLDRVLGDGGRIERAPAPRRASAGGRARGGRGRAARGRGRVTRRPWRPSPRRGAGSASGWPASSTS